MTLDISKFITNSIKLQAKIRHLDLNVKTVKNEKIPESVRTIIIDKYGETYLDDSTYVSFFWGALNKDNLDKLFNVCDAALGKQANKMTRTDFKKIDISGDSTEDSDSEDSEPEDSEEDAESGDEGVEDDEVENSEPDEEVEDAGKEDSEEDSEDASDDEKEEDVEDELNSDAEEAPEPDEDTAKDVKKVLSEDDEEEQEESIPTGYFFLKITAK